MSSKYELIPVPGDGNEEINIASKKTTDFFKDAINWYERKSRGKRLGSLIIRFFTIVLFIFGSSIPFLNDVPAFSEFLALNPNQGYLAFALAGFLFSIDKFWGFSNAWMRYVSTRLQLENSWFLFEQKWVTLVLAYSEKCLDGSKTSLCDLYDALYDLKIEVQKIVEEETNQWIAEFKSNLAEFEKLIKSKAEELKPGSLFVGIDNATELKEVTIDVSGKVYTLENESGRLIKNLKPGDYQLTVRAEKSGVKLEQTKSITITAGVLTKEQIKLN